MRIGGRAAEGSLSHLAKGIAGCMAKVAFPVASRREAKTGRISAPNSSAAATNPGELIDAGVLQ